MKFFVGTSGYSYSAWKGAFYPAKIQQPEMLRFYAQQFSTVELNNSFYQMPTASGMESLARQVPGVFRFAVKAPQVITHRKRLKDAGPQLKEFLHAASALKRRRGPLLFQLPPNMKKDLPRLQAFLKLLDRRTLAAFEFRHESWFDDEVFGALRKNSCALCVADTDDSPAPRLVSTANWGYVRLRRSRYTKKRLGEWIQRLRTQPWTKAYVFFKHEETGTGPKFASQFLDLADS